MRVRREEVQRQIQDEEVEKGKIQQDLAVLTKRLAQINNSLARKVGEGVKCTTKCSLCFWPKFLCSGSLLTASDNRCMSFRWQHAQNMIKLFKKQRQPT